MSLRDEPLVDGGLVAEEEEKLGDENTKASVRHRGRRKNKDMEEAGRKRWEESVKSWRQVIETMTRIKKTREVIEEKKQKKKQEYKQCNEPFGDKMTQSSRWPNSNRERIIRVYSQNVNGISARSDYSEWEILLDCLHEKQVDIACLTEVNLDLNIPEVKYKLIEKAKKLDKNIKIVMTASKTTTHGYSSKRGGIMTIIRGNWSSRICKSGEDKLGRWTYIMMQGKKGKMIKIYTVYRVCDQRHQQGNCTIYLQQKNDLMNAGRGNEDPRKALLSDLLQQINKDQAEGHRIIINGDMNEDLYKVGSITQFLGQSGLYNVIQEKHEAAAPPTYDRGMKCIDLIATSDTIGPNQIRRCGYLSFYDGVFSDHRAAFMDLEADSILDRAEPDLTKEIFKRFNTSNVNKCEKYVNALHKHLEEARIEEKIDELEIDIIKLLRDNEGMRTNIILKTKILFNKTTQLMKSSERKVGRKPYKNGYPMSQEVREAGDNLVHTRKLMRQENRKKEKNIHTIADLESRRDECKKALQEAQKSADKYRAAELDRLATKRAEEWNLKASQAIVVIKAAEDAKKSHRRQRAFLKPSEGGGIRQVYVPIPRTDIIPDEKHITDVRVQSVVEDPKEVFNILLRQNFKSLLKSQNSVFTDGILTQKMGNDLEKKLTEDILAGIEIDKEIQASYSAYEGTFERFITSLKYATKENTNEKVEEYTWTFGIKEYKEVFSKTKETTVCGPSGIHMSHWKAALESERLMRVHSFFIWAAFSIGFSYDRWNVSWHSMIQKKKYPFAQKLRIIQLFEGDFNAGLKYIIGRKLMWHLHDNGLLDDEIYGSRKGKTGSEALISLQLLADHSRTWKKNLAVLFNDAAGCFDRIPPTLAEIALRRVGVPENATKAHTISQRSMRHFIKTSVGVSKGYIKFGRCYKKIIRNGTIFLLMGLIGGVGQGGGSSPIIWMVILLILLDAYKLTQKGAQVWDSVEKKGVNLSVISYVDDNSIVRHFDREVSLVQMINGIKDNLREWHKLLQLTGGDLSLDKCKVTIMKWVQEGEWGRIHLVTKKKVPGTVEISSILNQQKTEKLERLDPTEAERVLGIRLPLSGDMDQELKHRVKQLEDFSSKLYNSPLSHHEAYSAFRSRYISIATYPYTVTTFSTKELDLIQKKPLRKILPKLGINRNMPRVVLFGPSSIGGRQLTDLRVEQPARNFYATLGHLRRGDKVAALLMATVRDLQIETGISEPVLTVNPESFPYITTNTRWGYTWNMAWEHKLKIVIHDMWTPTKRYTNDRNIMEVAIKDVKYQGKNSYKLQTINQCRMYQEAFFIGDLADKDGTTIPIEYLNGSGKHVHDEVAFPEMLKPTNLQWREWKTFIFRNFLAGSKQFHPTLGHLQKERRSTINEIQSLQESAITHTTVQQFLDNLPPHLRQIVKITVENCKAAAIAASCLNGTLVGATDGSLIDTKNGKRGAHSFLLIDEHTDQGMIKGSAPTPISTEMTSLTTEIYGLLAVTILLKAITVHYQEDNIINTPVRIYCDNEQAVNMANNLDPPINTSETIVPEYDLQALIHKIKAITMVPIQYIWIKGHQDEDKSTGMKIFGPFPRPVELNIIADQEAHRTAHATKHISVKRPIYGTTIMGAYTMDNTYISDMKKEITNSMHKQNLWLYLQKKNKWTDSSMEHIMWDDLAMTLNSYIPIFRSKIMQLMYDWQYVWERKHLMKESEDKCPMLCGAIETRLHYLWCKDKAFCETRKKHLSLLHKQLDSAGTYPGITATIMKIVTEGINGTWRTLTNTPTQMDKLLEVAVLEQAKLGEHSLIKGYMVHEWVEAQRQWQATGSYQQGQWTSNVIKALHTYAFSMWKSRNDILHNDKVKSVKARKRGALQDRIDELYKRVRTNLKDSEKRYFHLPVEQRKMKGIEAMTLWIELVEAIFRKRGQAHQTNIDDWLTGTTPEKNWKDKYKSDNNLTDTGRRRARRGQSRSN